MDKKGTITELWKTAGGTRWKVGLLLFMRAAIAFINVAVALLLRDLINAAVAQQKELFFSKAVFFIGLICGRVAAGAANRFLQERISAELENKWKTRLFDALLRQDYGYVSAVHSGEWMTRLTNDTVVVAGGMTNLLPDLGGMLIRLVGAAAAILFMEPRFLYLLVPGTAALIGLSYLSRKQMKQLHKQVQEEDGALRTCLQESFSGMLVVRSYGVEPMALQQAETHMERHKAARLRRNRFSNLCNTGFSALMNTVYVAGACYCGYGILTGTISYGTFTAILQLIGQLQAPLANLSGVLPRYYAMVSSAERLLEAEAGANSEPQKKTVDEVLEVYENRLEKLVLEDISFSYRRSQGCGTPGAVEQLNRSQVLSGWNFSIRKGDYVAMTGPSACGIHKQAPDLARVLAMDLKKVYMLSRSQSLNALTYLALEQMKKADGPEIPDPDRILPAWAESRNKAIRKVMLLDGARAQLFAYLEEKGIWHLPLKGIILAPLYPELGTRQEVWEWFVAHGYTAESYGEGTHDEYHKAPVYNFEMHVALFNKTAQPQMAEYYQTLKNRLKLATGKAYEYCMTDEDFYLYLLAHMYKHYSNNGTGLRSLLDVYVYNRAKDKLDRAYLDRELQKMGLLEFEEQMRLLADKFFDPARKKTDLAEQEWEILYELSFNHTYGRIENSWRNTVWKTRPEGEPITAGVKVRYILRRLFPTRAHMEKWCELYSPFFHRHKWLMPAARVWRFVKAEKEQGTAIKKEFHTVRKM